MIPYPRLCLATLSPSLNRDPGGEPLRGLTGGQARPVHPSLSLAPRRQPPPPFALARARWAKNPPSLVSSEFLFLFPFSISFSFFYFFFLFSYIYSYIDILCTKNSLNKL
jgi:hypothetical protein